MPCLRAADVVGGWRARACAERKTKRQQTQLELQVVYNRDQASPTGNKDTSLPMIRHT